MSAFVKGTAESELLDLDGRMRVLFTASRFSVHVQSRHSKSLPPTRSMQMALNRANRHNPRGRDVVRPKVGFGIG